MRSNGLLGYVLSGSAVLALLAGCSGGGGTSASTPITPQSVQPGGTRSVESFTRGGGLSTSVAAHSATIPAFAVPAVAFAAPDATKSAAIVVSDAVNNTVSAFTAAGKLKATITGFSEPQGLAADSSGDIYIADTANSRVQVYKNDYKTLKASLADASQYPAGVAVDTMTGVVGVTNIISTAGGAGSVSFYAKGATKPCTTVSNASFARVYFDGFDAKGNLYIDGSNSSGSVVVGVITGGCAAKSITTLTTGNSILFPGGVNVSPKGDVVIDDQEGYFLYAYKPALKGSLGKPVTSTSLSGASDPVTFAFNKAATSAFTADAGLAEALGYKYPAGGSPTLTITGFGQPIGVAVTPVDVP